jgi:hypothetical protein
MARKLEFEISGKSNVDPAVNKAKASIDSLGERMKKAMDFKGALTSAFLGAFGAATLLNKTVSLVTDGLRDLAKVADEQQKSGIGAEEYQKLAFAAQDAGVSLGTLTRGIREIKKFMREASDDADKMRILTDGLGLSADEVKKGNVSASDAFRALSAVLKNYESDVDKATIMNAIFSDKVSSEMIPALEALNDPKLTQGLVTATKEQLKLIDESDRAWSKLWANVKTQGALALASVTAGYQKYLGALEYYAQTGSLQGFAPMESQRKDFEKWYSKQMNPPVAETKTQSNEQAKANLDVFKKQNDTSSEKKNTFSPDQGPTGGVIGIGNNASILVSLQQLDVLMEIRDNIRNVIPQGSTDFTKEQLERNKFTA